MSDINRTRYRWLPKMDETQKEDKMKSNRKKMDTPSLVRTYLNFYELEKSEVLWTSEIRDRLKLIVRMQNVFSAILWNADMVVAPRCTFFANWLKKLCKIPIAVAPCHNSINNPGNNQYILLKFFIAVHYKSWGKAFVRIVDKLNDTLKFKKYARRLLKWNCWVFYWNL